MQLTNGLYSNISFFSDVHSRPTAHNDASHSVGEAIGEQAGNVIVHDLHLAALELSNLVQTDLVLLRILVGGKRSRAGSKVSNFKIYNSLTIVFLTSSLNYLAG